jgi:hypothetical protein
MTQQRTDQTLSTADMVSAGEGPRPIEETRADDVSGQTQNGGAISMPPAQDKSAAPASAQSGASPRDGAGAETTPLVPSEQAASYRSHWEEIQTGFVDEPRQAVEQADHLVAEVIKRVAEVFADERSKLEGQWSQGNQVDTEQLRMALKRYRSFFERLLSA